MLSIKQQQSSKRPRRLVLSFGSNSTLLLMQVLLLLLLVFLPSNVSATLYVGNETYASLPALFGRYMLDGRKYTARLQYLPENPYLCEEITPSSFHPSRSQTLLGDGNNNNNNNITLPGEPIVLLAARGNCPFRQKAVVAENLHESVQFLAIYNNKDQGEDVLVPMYSEFGDTRLVLVSVTHAAGKALKAFFFNQTEDVVELGGPRIQLDSQPPPGMVFTPQDLQSMLVSVLGLFFMMLSLVGCMVIVIGTYGQIRINNGRIIVVTSNGTSSVLGGRRLLSPQEVMQLQQQQQQQQSCCDCEGDTTDTDNEEEDDDENDCAVCIDNLNGLDPSQLLILPCKHKFHLDCILPWLTERQSKCPLCKFDVLEHVRNNSEECNEDSEDEHDVHDEQSNNNNNNTGEQNNRSRSTTNPNTTTPISVWGRFFRYRRWTQVEVIGDSTSEQSSSDHEEEDVEQPPQNTTTTTTTEVELTLRPSPPAQNTTTEAELTSRQRSSLA